MTGSLLKSMDCWGGQNGLLSVAEIDLLQVTIMKYSMSILEVGHYYGLSTCAIVYAMKQSEYRKRLVTIDAHCADPWVPATNPDAYFANKAKHFADEYVMTLIQRSEAVTRLDGFDTLFYDGDHGEEQMRWTIMAANTEGLHTIIFDDRDFEVPLRCSAYLREQGWTDHSPPIHRGVGDKENPQTMTLAVFTNDRT